jgi:hypothetical protein
MGAGACVFGRARQGRTSREGKGDRGPQETCRPAGTKPAARSPVSLTGFLASQQAGFAVLPPHRGLPELVRVHANLPVSACRKQCWLGSRRDRPDICLRNQWDVTLFERARSKKIESVTRQLERRDTNHRFPDAGNPLTRRATTSPFQAGRNWSRQDRDTARRYFAPHTPRKRGCLNFGLRRADGDDR